MDQPMDKRTPSFPLLRGMQLNEAMARMLTQMVLFKLQLGLKLLVLVLVYGKQLKLLRQVLDKLVLVLDLSIIVWTGRVYGFGYETFMLLNDTRILL